MYARAAPTAHASKSCAATARASYRGIRAARWGGPAAQQPGGVFVAPSTGELMLSCCGTTACLRFEASVQPADTCFYLKFTQGHRGGAQGHKAATSGASKRQSFTAAFTLISVVVLPQSDARPQGKTTSNIRVNAAVDDRLS